MLKHICKSVSKDVRISVFDSIDLVNSEHWDKLTENGPIFLRRQFLKALEESVGTLDFRYMIIYDESLNPVVVASCQLIDFDDIDETYRQWLKTRFGEKLSNMLLEQLSFRLMVCGNLFACGEYGYCYSQKLSKKDALKLLNKGLDRIQKSSNGDKACISLIKEIPSKELADYTALSSDRYHNFSIDHNMVLSMHSEWRTEEDYLQSMTSKFRTKMKSILKKSASIETEEWNTSDIREQEDKIHELYEQVLDRAEFNLGVLEPNSFSELKQALGDDMVFMAYLYDGELTGFSVAFDCADHIDAAYVGFDYQLNDDLAIYQKMLFDFVSLTIKRKRSKLHFGRTAEQLKSSFGAEPAEMVLMVKHRNSIANHVIKSFVSRIEPSKFELRKPFKANFEPAWIH